MPKFRITFSFLQGASFKSYDWLPGMAQPVGRITRTEEVEAENEKEAIEKLGKAEHLTMTRELTDSMSHGYIENIEVMP